MATPTEFLTGKIGALVSGGKKKAGENSQQLGAAGNALINTNPVGAMLNTVRQGAPALVNGVTSVGTAINNNPTVKGFVNDPLVQSLVGTNPLGNVLNLGLQGAQAADRARSGQKPAAPPQADQSSTMINRTGVTPVNGSFRTAVEQGKDGKVTPSSGNAGSGGQSTDPEAPAYIEPGDGSGGSGGSETRVNENNVVQRGLNLGGVNQFLAGLGIGNLSDMNELYGSPEKNTDMPGMELPETGQGLGGQLGATASTPETTSNPGGDQDGASDKPDIADQVRAIRVGRGAGGAVGAAAAQPTKSEGDSKNSGTNWGARTMADNSDIRMRMRSAFLNDDVGSLQALRAAEKEAGIFKQNGKVFYNEGGELKQATENSTQFYRTAMQGKNPTEFADKPVEVTPNEADTPAPAEISPEQQPFVDASTKSVKDKAQQFASSAVARVKANL